MFKKIDWYIISKFLGTFFFTVLLFIAIAIAIDISEKIDDFVDKDAPFGKIVFDYYLNFIPWIGLLLSPFFVFIAVLFFTSRMAYRSEIIACYSSGISFYRILLVPYMVAAIILTALQLYANHYLVPRSNESRMAFESEYLNKNKMRSKGRNMHLQISPDTYVYLENFNSRDTIGYKFSVEKFEDNKLKAKLRADKIEWVEDKWRIHNFYERAYFYSEEIVTHGYKKDTTFNLKPDDFVEKFRLKEAMTTAELKAHIDDERSKGAGGLEIWEVERHRRSSTPFATILLTIIGFSIASRKMRGGMGLHLLFGFALSAAYVVFLQFSSTFSTNGNLPPIVGVWIPNIVFALISIYLVRIAHK